MREHESGEHVERQQRHLIASDRHKSADRAGRQARAPRRALERTRHEPERKRQVGQADDLPGVLYARTGRAAQRKCHRSHERAAGMPAAVVEQ